MKVWLYSPSQTIRPTYSKNYLSQRSRWTYFFIIQSLSLEIVIIEAIDFKIKRRWSKSDSRMQVFHLESSSFLHFGSNIQIVIQNLWALQDNNTSMFLFLTQWIKRKSVIYFFRFISDQLFVCSYINICTNSIWILPKKPTFSIQLLLISHLRHFRLHYECLSLGCFE